MACIACMERDGTCVFPHYGRAPHDGIGRVLYPADWPLNFIPDEKPSRKNDQCGVWGYCTNCGDGDQNAVKASKMAEIANECCYRSEGWEEDLRRRFYEILTAPPTEQTKEVEG